MKPACFAIAFFLLSSGLAASAEAAPKFEVAAIFGSPKDNAALFRIEVATGKVADVWGVGTNSFTAVPDAAPLPAGEYHLVVTNNSQPDATVSWTLSRIEVDSGRTWWLTGGGNAPFAWVEIQPPK